MIPIAETKKGPREMVRVTCVVGLLLAFCWVVPARGTATPGEATPEIIEFVAYRTVIKAGRPVPLSATIRNTGADAGSCSSLLELPEGAVLLDGERQTVATEVPPEGTVTLNWTVRFEVPGSYTVTLRVTSGSVTANGVLSMEVTDRYWRPQGFLLSAYNPPFAWHGPPYEDAILTDYEGANFHNMLWVRDDDVLLAMVHQHGFRYLLDVGGLIGEELLRGTPDREPPEVTEEQLALVDEAIERHRDDPHLVGYYLCDEPFETGFPNIAKVIRRIREKDPERFSFVNLWPYFEGETGGDAYVESFLQTTRAEVLCSDRYNFFNGWDENEAYFDNLRRIRRFALKYDLPFYNIVQAVGTDGTSAAYLDWRTPSRAEHRWLAYSSLAYGVHGLIWFHWDHEWGVTGNPYRGLIYPSLRDLNAELQVLGPVMARLRTSEVFHTRDGAPPDGTQGVAFSVPPDTELVVGVFRDEEGRVNHFMLMNEDYTTPVSASVTMNHILEELQVFDVSTGRWEDVPFANGPDGAAFDLRLRPGGGKLYRFDGKPVRFVRKSPGQDRLLPSPPGNRDPGTLERR